MKRGLLLAVLVLLWGSVAGATGYLVKILTWPVQAQLLDGGSGAMAVGGSTAGKYTCCTNDCPTPGCTSTPPVVIGGPSVSVDGGTMICKGSCGLLGACYAAAPNALYVRMVARVDGGAKLNCTEGR